MVVVLLGTRYSQATCGCRPPPAITQEEVQEEKARLKAIDARPIKQVTEAKARKQKRMAVSTTPSPFCPAHVVQPWLVSPASHSGSILLYFQVVWGLDAVHVDGCCVYLHFLT